MLALESLLLPVGEMITSVRRRARYRYRAWGGISLRVGVHARAHRSSAGPGIVAFGRPPTCYAAAGAMALTLKSGLLKLRWRGIVAGAAACVIRASSRQRHLDFMVEQVLPEEEELFACIT
mgnify:CR=1 FL=1